MDGYKDFKRAYKEYFIENPDFLSSKLICGAEDIPTGDTSYKNAVIRAYKFLSNCSSRDVGHLKILTNYEKLIRKNREGGMHISAIDFAAVLYIFHNYCVRLLRSPWRRDFFTIKAYNGFYQHNLRKHLTPTLITELLLVIGFEYDPVSNVFSLEIPTLNRSSLRTITEAGIGFFLSYTHCMAKNDPRFKKNMMALTYLILDPPKNEAMASMPTYRNPDSPGPSGISDFSIRTHNGDFSSNSRQRRRDRRNIYGSGRPTSARDLYNAQECPVDLTVKHRLGNERKDEETSIYRPPYSSHGSSHLDYVDDRALYDESPSSPSYLATNEGNSSMENSLNGRVLYPPNSTRLTDSALDAQFENCRFEDRPADVRYTERTKVTEKQFPNRNGAAKDNNYVQLIPTSAVRRGSPDGQITTEAYIDHPGPKNTTSSLKEMRSMRSAHIYHEINDKDLYE